MGFLFYLFTSGCQKFMWILAIVSQIGQYLKKKKYVVFCALTTSWGQMSHVKLMH